MTVLFIILGYGTALSLMLSALLLTMIRANPRLMLQDYPKDIQATVPPKRMRQNSDQGPVWRPLLVIYWQSINTNLRPENEHSLEQ